MMRYQLKMVVLAFTLLIATTPDAEAVLATTPDLARIGSIIAAAAADLDRHVAPKGIDFRDVRSGVMRGDTGIDRNLLCGEFRASGAPAWAAFATIETSPYEQCLGAVATAHCTAPGTTLDTSRDWSTPLGEAYRQQK